MSTANSKYFQLTAEQIDKVGNAMIYLSQRIAGISKTKMLKLLYLLDEFSIRNSGIPFFNLQYKVWKLGPVANDIFIELSDKPSLFSKYITIKADSDTIRIYPKDEFCDDEFSDNDMNLIEYVAEKFISSTAGSLIEYTHRPNSPWRKTAEENNVYILLENECIKSTEFIIDMSCLVSHDERKKGIYQHYLEEN
jgi:uncharacterized phage-associated protein